MFKRKIKNMTLGSMGLSFDKDPSSKSGAFSIAEKRTVSFPYIEDMWYILRCFIFRRRNIVQENV